MRFKNRTVLISGGAGGIGAACAQRFSEEGAEVFLADRDLEAAHALASKLGGQGLEMDVSEPTSVEKAFAALPRLDVLLNTAAVTHIQPLVDYALEDWERLIRTNLTGAFLCAQAAARRMQAQGAGGAILNLSSVNGQRALSGRGAYSVAKAGLDMLTKMLAIELADAGIRVNGIAPGPVNTPMVKAANTPEMEARWRQVLPIARFAEPKEVAALAAFLASDEAAYLSGQTFNVDGGFGAAGILFNR